MSAKTTRSVVGHVLDGLFALGVLALLFIGLITPLLFEALFGLGEAWAFLLSTALFGTLCLLAVVRQRRFIHSEPVTPRFVSLAYIIWQRGLAAVVVSGLLLTGSVLHGIFVSTGLLNVR